MNEIAGFMTDRRIQSVNDLVSDRLEVTGRDLEELLFDNSRHLSGMQSGLATRWAKGNPIAPEMSFGRRLALSGKRATDIVGALAGLFLLAPLLVIVAIIIRMTDHGPVFFRQSRAGLHGKEFRIFKFRSMYAAQGDLSGIRQTVANDPRVTPIGAFIRKTSIDELPQLLNVLFGDMSLVGPRPHVRGMLAGGVPYEELTEHYEFRHVMRPGLTGWAQANGLRGPTTDERKALARVGHDIAYVQNFSLQLDMRIMVKTVVSELLSKTAH